MLSRLSIRDIVLIERLDIDFSAGLSVLTGETGAGKSILLDALSLALGARGDASLVRHGATQGQVTAVFDVPLNHPARAILSENALDDDGDIILRRVQSADGRTRVFVNDQPSSVTASTTSARWLTPPRTGSCSTPSAAISARSRGRGRRGRPGARPSRSWHATAQGSRPPPARPTICAPRWPSCRSSTRSPARRRSSPRPAPR